MSHRSSLGLPNLPGDVGHGLGRGERDARRCAAVAQFGRALADRAPLATHVLGAQHGLAERDEGLQVGLHGSGGLGLGQVELGGQLGGQMLTSKCRHDTIGDPRGEWVGPLFDSLVADADSLGCGGHGSAQQVNGLGFLHAPLNHSSWHFATMVRALANSLPEVSTCGFFHDLP